jgi:hypothetical protein
VLALHSKNSYSVSYGSHLRIRGLLRVILVHEIESVIFSMGRCIKSKF